MVTFVQSYSYNRPFDGSHNVEVALSENEFDTPVLNHSELFIGALRKPVVRFWVFINEAPAGAI